MICGVAFNAPAQTITTTPTNGPTTITVHARTKDGKVPVGVSCEFGKSLVKAQNALTPQWSEDSKSQMPSFVGTNGDWIATNVPSGYLALSVVLRSTNYAEDSHTEKIFNIHAGTNYAINFVLSRGATFKGRVLDDSTGKPIAQIVVQDNSLNYVNITDSEGRYEWRHGADAFEIHVIETNYVWQVIKMDATAEDSTVTTPDIRLQLGGWISGRVEHPTKLEKLESDLGIKADAMVMPKIQGSLANNSVIDSVFYMTNDTFRVGPLPTGNYTLHSGWQQRGWIGGKLPQWSASGSVSNITVIAGQETANVFIPTKVNP